ncbi:MAG TPA: pyridoxamine 5'-phosphate oxidase family protein [Burkholderiaceae bacterium]
MQNSEAWTQGQDETTFHAGERSVHQRLGIADKIAERGRQVIRDHMPDQHRDFFAQLPFLIVGSADQAGQPSASVLVGQPGFIASPHARRLEVNASALFADPLHDTLHLNAQLGLLGIEPHTRRRNRANGTVSELSKNSFSLDIKQSFGNCPKYIQARIPRFKNDAADSKEKIVHRSDQLNHVMCRMIASADTFFIATAYLGEGNGTGRQYGSDVSHRGGKPGFIRIDDPSTITVPDLIGNFYFNTIGNLVANPRAGLLFIDFASGDLLYVQADAEIIWNGDEVSAFPGAQRLLRFHITQAVRVERSLPLYWSEPEQSPYLDKTGSWDHAEKQGLS